MVDGVDDELKVIGDLSRKATFGRAGGRIDRAGLEEMITVGVDFGVEDVKETSLNAEFVFELPTGCKQMVNVAWGKRIGAFDVSGENDGQVVAHVLSKLDNTLGLFGKLGVFLVRILGSVPFVVESLLVDEGIVKAVDADNGNVIVGIVGGDFLNGAVDFVECVQREKIFLVSGIIFFETAPRQCALVVDVKDNGFVGVKGLEGEGFA